MAVLDIECEGAGESNAAAESPQVSESLTLRGDADGEGDW